MQLLRGLAYRLFLHQRRRAGVEARATELLSVTVDGVTHDAGSMCGDELAALLDVCSPAERECVVLCYGFGFTVAELADAQGCPPGTIKSHLHRARKKMRAVDAARTGTLGEVRPNDI